MSTLCKAAWNHIQINAEGTINPCCMFSPTIYLNQYDNLQDAFDGIENQTMRNNMLKNVSIEGCHKCDLYESLNKKSYRSYFNEKYDDSTIGNPKIRELEIALDNVCNFKCVTCSSRFSNAWFEEDKQLNEINLRRYSLALEKNSPIINNEIDLKKIDLSELRFLKIIGGEPFINKKYLSLLELVDLSKLDFLIVTNNSIFPKKWIKYILEMKKATIFISLDGVYEVGEFVRYGMNFDKFNRNLLKWKKISENNKNVNLIFNFVAHSMNILNYNDTRKYLIDMGFDIRALEIDFLKEPSYINLINLPLKTKNFIEKILIKTEKSQMIIDYMYSKKENTDKINDFIKYFMFLENRKTLPLECEIIFNNVIENK